MDNSGPRAAALPSAARRRTRVAVAGGLLVLLAGCGKIELYTNLQEREANEMMALLLNSGVACNKSAGDEEQTWELLVSSQDFSRSVETLKSAGYPRYRHERMGEVFQKSGLVSSPTEDRIRYVYALSEELSETISRIDGIIDARVHVVLPNNDPFSETVIPSSASVYIKHREDADMTATRTKIQDLVAKSIERLDSENIDVFTDVAEPLAVSEPDTRFTHVIGMKLGAESVRQFWLLVGGLATVALVNLGIVVWYASGNLRGRFSGAAAADSGHRHSPAGAPAR